jgi:hypothetical protein
MTFSLRPARPVTILMVEHGLKPLRMAQSWLTTVSTRPVFGSMTTTLPARSPSACTATRRTSRSSPVVSSLRMLATVSSR